MKVRSFGDDADEDRVGTERLEQCKQSITECAQLLDDPEAADSPQKLVDTVRRKLTEQRTKKCRNDGLIAELEKMGGSKGDTLEFLRQRLRTTETELKESSEELSQIERENSEIESRLNELKRASNRKKEIVETLSSIQQITEQAKLAQEEGERLRQEEADLKSKLSALKNSNIAELLAEEKTKQMNVQNAIDALRAEEEKKSNARHIFLSEKRRTLKQKLEEIAKQKRSFLCERDRINHIREEIERFRALIARESRKPEQTETTEVPTPHQVSLERASRLVMLLLTDGPKPAIVQCLGEELEWNEKQAAEFTALAQKSSKSGWAEWLRLLVEE